MHSQKVPSIVTLYSKYTRVLTFENVCQRSPSCSRSEAPSTKSSSSRSACRRRQQDQHGARHQRGQPDPCWQHMCWQHMCCQHTCWQQAWAVLNAIQQLRAAYYICIFLYIAADSRATAPLCWQHMCWSKDRHRAHFERRAQRRQSGRAVRWSTASTTNCIFPSSLLHKP